MKLGRKMKTRKILFNFTYDSHNEATGSKGRKEKDVCNKKEGYREDYQHRIYY